MSSYNVSNGEGSNGFTLNELDSRLGYEGGVSDCITVNAIGSQENEMRAVEQADAENAKWTYLMYLAADNDLDYSALFDLISIQRSNIDERINVYVLVDRPDVPWDWEEGAIPSVNGIYEWDSVWTDTCVGKIKHDPGLTLTVDWESWGELDTGDVGTLERFVDWVQAESPSENYALILWDHGEEFATLCYDFTTSPELNAYLTVSEISEVVKEKGNIPLVIFNSCMAASDIATTQMAGSTEVMVAPESPSMSNDATYAYRSFFTTITADMTAQEMAEVLVQNVREAVGMPYPSMLTAIDVTDTRLADSLEALAQAVCASNNINDQNVLIQAMLTAPQRRCLYEGGMVMQSDLKDMILQAKAEPDYTSTSESFRTALADVEAALDAVVLDYRSAPANSGHGIGFANMINVSENYLARGYTADKIDAIIQNYLATWYGSNPQWAELLRELSKTYLAQNAGAQARTAIFDEAKNSELVGGNVVQVKELGGFCGRGEVFDGIALDGEVYFGFTITATDKSTGSIQIENDAGASISAALLDGDGTVLANGDDAIAFSDLALGDYFLRLGSETQCGLTLSFDADWLTGVDRFDYAGSGSNEKHANGNETPATASVLGPGYYSGLLTSMGDSDFYQFVNTGTDMVRIAVESPDGNCLHVNSFSLTGIPVTGSRYKAGVYTLTMSVEDRLFVEGDANLDLDQINAYSITVIPYEETPVVLSNLSGTQDGVSWEAYKVDPMFLVEYSMDDFEHVLSVQTSGWKFDTLDLPTGTYQWHVKSLPLFEDEVESEWVVGNEIISENDPAEAKVVESNADGNTDIFFATPVGTWENCYYARHVGSLNDNWTGTNERVSASGKGRIHNLFFGSADVSALYLTDSENGDALFVDDVYTDSPDNLAEETARLFQITEIYAGAGDDIVDMTSQRFEYTGDLTAIYGGDGDDVIWANSGDNQLYGDAGNDRIVDGAGYDFIVGGIGNDRMHGGGGDDIFTFCENWGTDTVEQLADGSVMLWFASGSLENWNADMLTYTDGTNSVTVSGIDADQISLQFGDDNFYLFADLEQAGGFLDFCSQHIFEESDKGRLAII